MELLKIIEDVCPCLSSSHCPSLCLQMIDFCVSDDPRNTGGIGGDNMTCVIIRLNLDPNASTSSAK